MAFASMHDRKRAWELASLINPINHAATAKTMAVYKVEPYVIAADVYAVSPHIGRGGWTWYTGSAGWMYRLITESLLGIRLEVNKLHVAPLLPEGWKGLKLHYRYRETFYHITVTSTGAGTAVRRVTVDGHDQPDLSIPMTDDRADHRAEVEVG
jgi:cellobiose phosphorylase